MNLFTIPVVQLSLNFLSLQKLLRTNARLWINGKVLSSKWFTFMPSSAATSIGIEWLNNVVAVCKSFEILMEREVSQQTAENAVTDTKASMNTKNQHQFHHQLKSKIF
jgi:hypothetical protein